jgi:regulation of enolase protein 1 (concanavalin A-like superfamily)
MHGVNRPRSQSARGLVIAVLCLLIIGFGLPTKVSAAADEWPTSLHDVARTAASADTTVTTANAAQLRKRWSLHTGGPVASSPTVVGGTAYFGSWDGYEYAVDAASGALKWKTFLGITTANPICIPPQLGVSSPATVQNGTVYVGGGDSYWYALDAATGVVKWKVFTGDNSAAGGHYNWSGPLIYNGYAYIGIASEGDCPLVQGKLLKVNITTGQVENTLNIVPDGQVGGGIWTSPAIDTSTNTIYTATGTENSPTQPYAQSFLAIDAGTMAIKDHWRLPESEAVLDSDFSTSTTLFSDTQGRKLVAAINKNGYAYAFLRSNLAGGPVWKQYVAEGGECPTCGQSSVSSGAFTPGKLFMAGNDGVINGWGFPGTVRALNPDSGGYLWQHSSPGPVIGALAYANGLVFAGGGSVFEVLDATSGSRLFSYDTGAQIYAGPTVANGIIYTGNTAGDVYAFSVGNSSPPADDPGCPAGFTCQDIGSPSPTGSETVSGGNWTVTAGGGGIGGTTDSFRLASQPASGDVQITSRVTSQSSASAGAQAGLMLRQNSDPGSPYYAVVVNPNGGLQVLYRTQFGGATSVHTATRGALPLYLMIQRVGDRIQAATSTDGTNYTVVAGSSANLYMPGGSLAGLAASSGANGTPGTASFASLGVGPPTITPQVSGAVGCPAGWTCRDIGNPDIAGSQSVSGGTWTLKGAGGDIWGESDQFHYAWQSISGDGTVSAHVTSQLNTDPSAKTGVMLRSSTDPGSAYYAAYITPANGIQVQYRAINGLSAHQAANPGGTVPAYLRVARSGDSFTAYTSPDGNNWNVVPGSTVTLSNIGGPTLAGLAITSHNSGALGSATIDSVAIGSTAPPPPNLCPPGWTCQDIGNGTPKGGQSLANGVWTVDSGGGDIWDTYDQFRLISQNLNGDGNVTAHLISQENTGEWAKAGAMLRLNNDPQAPYYAVFATPAHGVVVQWRTSQGGTTSQLTAAGTGPLWLRVARSGTTFTAYTSSDGARWTAIAGSQQSISTMAATLLGGMAADSYNPSQLNTTQWDNVTIAGSGGASGLPQPWVDGDIGSPTPAGSATFADNTFTVKGGGTDIWGATDQLNYVSQPLVGDGSITARVTSQTNTDPWAKAGVMIKESTTAGSKYAAMMVTPGNGYRMQYNFNGDQGGGTYTFPNAWVRLTRDGNVFTAYRSSDGSNWVQVGQTTLAMQANATVGMFVNAHSGGTALGTATFDNVKVTSTGGGALPTPWTSVDVGSPTPPGSSSYGAGTFTVKGGGTDVWGTDDQMQLASQPLTGDGTIVARVTAQDNTDPWAKSGIIFKQSTAAGSPYSAVMVTPGNGVHMQSNFNQDIAGGTFAFPNAWLKLVRSGSTFTSYKSSDGVNWTPVGTANISMPSSAVVGLFVTAHGGGALLNTTTFDSVTVTPACNPTCDTTAPSSSASSPGFSTSPSLSVAYSAADEPGGSGLARVDLYTKAPGDLGFTKVASDTSPGTSGSFSYLAAVDGSYSFYTLATDKAGNTQAAPASPQTTTVLDRVAPSSSASVAAVSGSSSVTVGYSAADGGSGLGRVDLYARAPGDGSYSKVASDASPSASGSFSYAAAAGDGSYSFYTVATDKAGNIEAAPSAADASTLIDTVAPSSSASAPASADSAPITVSYSASDNGGSGLASVDLYAKKPGASDYSKVASDASPGASGSFSYTPDGGTGSYSLYTRATDKAGNTESAPSSPDATTNYTGDSTAPQSLASSPSSATSAPITVSYSASDESGGSGLASVDLYAKSPGATVYSKVASDASPGASGSFSYTPDGGSGSYSFYTIATDHAGNVEPAPATADATTNYAPDTVPPSSSATVPAYSATTAVSVGYTAADTGGSGLASVELWVRTPGAASYAKAATDTSPGASGTFSYTAASGDGAYAFYAVAVDLAGNREAEPSAPDATTTVDTATPGAFQMADPGPYLGATVTLALSGAAPSDSGSGLASVAYQYRRSGDSGSWSTACTATNSPWSCNWNTGTVADASYDLRAVATDRAGNATVASNAPLTGRVDNTKPTASQIATTNVTGGMRGRIDAGDQATFTYSEPMKPSSILAGWSGASTAVQVKVIDAKAADRLEVWKSDGSARLALANPLALGGDYVRSGGAVFNGTMTQSGAAITVTLNSNVSGNVNSTAVTRGTLSWTPDTGASDLAGNTVTNKAVSATGPAF